MEKLLALPAPLLAAVGLLVVVQLTLQVYSLVDVARRTRVAALPKWAWVLIIIMGEILGAILYLALGRSVPQAAADPLARPAAGDDVGRAEKAADLLYGKR